jgi:hypothetical protein
LMLVRGRGFDGRFGATKKDKLENFEREIRETEWKCAVGPCFCRIGRLLEVWRRGGRL